MSVPCCETQYGFRYGAASVNRLHSHKKSGNHTGAVTIGITTPKHVSGIQVYVTKAGKVRVFSKDGEWKVQK